MSKITDVFNAYISKIEATLPTYARIANPYERSRNANIILRKGFGVGIGPAVNSDRLTGCQTSFARTFYVVLINQIIAKENDADGLSDNELLLMEDAFSLAKAVELDQTFNGVAATSKILGDSGIEFLSNDKGVKFFLTELEFETEYFDNLYS